MIVTRQVTINGIGYWHDGCYSKWGIDLSVGAVIALAEPFPLSVGWYTELGFGGRSRFIRALSLAPNSGRWRIQLPPFIVTLATMALAAD